MPAEITRILLQRAIMTEHVPRHEPEQRIVNLAFLRDAQHCPFAARLQLVDPAAAEPLRRVVDAADQPRRWDILIAPERQRAERRLLAPPQRLIRRRQNFDLLESRPPRHAALYVR